MPAISTTQTFAANEQITSTKLTNVLALSVIAPGAVSGDSTLTVTGGGQLQVGTLKTENFPAAYVNSFVPTGAIMAFGMNSVPTGWLACNGQSTSGYTALAALVGANVPDLRGYFVRGFGTNGDGVVSGAFGTTQADDLKSHNHNIYVKGVAGGANSAVLDGQFATGQYGTTNTGGTETRPRNIALLYCIKY